MRLARLAFLIVFVVAALGVMPQAAQAAIDVQCDGNLLLTVTLNPNNTYYYHVTGSGPGLPTASQVVEGNSAMSVTSTITFTVLGPGTWTGLSLEFSYDGTTWHTSDFNPNLTASCQAVGCAALVAIPSQAVGGTFTSNAEIYWAPGEVADTDYIEAGNSYLVAGQDATGMYRKVLIACEWVWVRAETVGPNHDNVWNGAPLPTTVVD